MALSLDSLTTVAADKPPGDVETSLGASMPAYAPLAMPAQSFRKFSRAERRDWVNPRLAKTPIFTRIAVFGGALALTGYGAYQMYKVVGVSGVITPLEWAMVVLFVVTFSWVSLSFTASVVGFLWLFIHGRKRA
ncbi:MAG TPA: glucan biosynthesis glucosyltransferase H, partial [Roseiarcus sp.]|nr:glucan biosynthesis glucosyltransferase H [Roseiarcus sp.]